ncbi:MAG: chalcone isomerase family protein [Burkholderiaceae bacterium]
MHSYLRKWSAAAGLALGLALVAGGAGAQGVSVEGIRFESTVQVGGQTLQLNGTGIRTRAIFKVYAAGLYVPKKSADAAGVIGEKGPRRVSLGLLRTVDADSFISSFNDGMKANVPEAQLAALKPRIDALDAILKSIGEAKKGDLINFDYTPEGGTRITVNGQARGNAIAGEDFYSAVLRIWLGGKPVDAGLKQGLLGQS